MATTDHATDKRKFSLARWLILLLALAGLLTTALMSTVWWTLNTAQGTAWLLPHLKRIGVEVTQPQGALQGQFSASKLVIKVGRTEVSIDAPRWHGLTLSYARYPGAWVVIKAPRVEADRVQVKVHPITGPTKPVVAPKGLRLPVEIDVDEAIAAEVRVPGLPTQAFWHVHTRARMGMNRGMQHHFDNVRGEFESLQLSGHAHIDATGPMAMDVALHAVQAEVFDTQKLPTNGWSKTIASAATKGWRAQATALGPLENFAMALELKAHDQQLNATAEATPFSPSAFRQLQANMQGFDASAVFPKAPITALSGQLSLMPLDQSKSLRSGVKFTGELTNAKPGTWENHQLPVLGLKFDLRGKTQLSPPLQLPVFEVVLGTTAKNAGTLRASGQWDAAELNFNAQLNQIKPALLDARLPAMNLSGPLTLSSHCTAREPPTHDFGNFLCHAAPETAPTFQAAANLNGHLSELNRAAELKLKASGTPSHIEVQELLAKAGGATATLSGKIHHTAQAWQVQTKVALVDFDPRVWLPGGLPHQSLHKIVPTVPAEQGGADAQQTKQSHHASSNVWGPHPTRLNVAGEAALSVPKNPHSNAELLAGIHGKTTLQWGKSVLAGVPMSGEMALQRNHPSDALQAKALLELGTNSFKLDGQLARATKRELERWRIDLKAPALATLAAPLKMLLPQANPAWLNNLSGALNMNGDITGRWPELNLAGQAQFSQITTGAMSLTKGEAQWQLSTQPNTPLSVKAKLSNAAFKGQRLETAELTLSGTAQAHELKLQTELKATPPLWMQSLQESGSHSTGSTLAKTQATLNAKGQLSGGVFEKIRPRPTQPTRPLQWQGTLDQF